MRPSGRDGRVVGGLSTRRHVLWQRTWVSSSCRLLSSSSSRSPASFRGRGRPGLPGVSWAHAPPTRVLADQRCTCATGRIMGRSNPNAGCRPKPGVPPPVGDGMGNNPAGVAHPMTCRAQARTREGLLCNPCRVGCYTPKVPGVEPPAVECNPVGVCATRARGGTPGCGVQPRRGCAPPGPAVGTPGCGVQPRRGCAPPGPAGGIPGCGVQPRRGCAPPGPAGGIPGCGVQPRRGCAPPGPAGGIPGCGVQPRRGCAPPGPAGGIPGCGVQPRRGCAPPGPAGGIPGCGVQPRRGCAPPGPAGGIPGCGVQPRRGCAPPGPAGGTPGRWRHRPQPCRGCTHDNMPS